MIKFFNNTPLQIVLAICIALFTGHLFDVFYTKLFLTLSTSLRDLLLIILPIAIFVYVSTLLHSMKNEAVFLVIALVLFEAFSNASSVIYALILGNGAFNNLNFADISGETENSITPLFSIKQYIPAFYSADKGTIFGVVLGILMSFGYCEQFSLPLRKLKLGIDFIFSKIFAKLVPILVFGFLLQLQGNGQLSGLINDYGTGLIFCMGAIIIYLGFLFTIAAKFNSSRLVLILKNTIPTGFIAFSSGSSVATMPFTIKAAQKNMQNPNFANLVIPATTSIQQIGDCIANVFLCAILLKQFGKPFPELEVLIPFVAAFVLARYATAGMIGGAIFIMIPIYETYLNFTPGMVAIILSLNVLLDPVITSANVLGNGALCIIFERFWNNTKRVLSLSKPH